MLLVWATHDRLADRLRSGADGNVGEMAANPIDPSGHDPDVPIPPPTPPPPLPERDLPPSEPPPADPPREQRAA